MKRLVFLAALAAIASCCTPEKETSLPRNFESGIKTERFDSVFVGVDSRPCDELHSLMVVKDGKVIYERWDTGHGPDELHVCWSVSKTFTATAVGFAVQDGLLSVDDRVVDIFPPEMLPEERSQELEALTVKHLLIMASGFKYDFVSDVNSRKSPEPTKMVLASEFAFFPGSRYQYNSINTFLLSAIVTHLTGKTVADYLKEKLFEPLGIYKYVWDESADGLSFGGWGLHTTTENLTKMGLFMLQKGVWNGRRLLDEAWFDEAMKVHIYQNPDYQEPGNDWAQGYCYQMWACTHGAVRMDGAHNQIVIISPEKNAVITYTAHVYWGRLLMEDVWKYVWEEL